MTAADPDRAGAGGPVRTIAVPLREFNGWGGGIDFIRLILSGLLRDPGLRVVALVPRRTWPHQARKHLSAAIAGLKGLARGGRWAWQPDRGVPARQVTDALADFRPRVEFRFHPDTSGGLRQALRRLRPDAAVPCIRPLPADFPVPWVGYIYDFQHRYFPGLFSEAERAGRDAGFERMLAAAKVVICNSETARSDAGRFHPGTEARILALPFAPIPHPEWFDLDTAAARRRHAVPERYFMVCNQFWVHKDHPTALRAFARFRALGGDSGMALVCTGKLEEPRDPAYPGRIRALIAELGLEGRVVLAGHVPKEDQIALLRGAVALVQPTLFEGGRGGGAVLDAVTLGVPSLVSDLPVNLEIEHEDVRFFPAGDPEALAALMVDVAAQPPVRKSREALLMAAEARVAKLAETLAEAVARCRAGRGA